MSALVCRVPRGSGNRRWKDGAQVVSSAHGSVWHGRSRGFDMQASKSLITDPFGNYC